MSTPTVSTQQVYTRVETVASVVVEHAWVVRGRSAPELFLPDGRGLVQVVVGARATTTDLVTGQVRDEGDVLRGLRTRAVVRLPVDPTAADARLGVQLHPVGPALLGLDDLLVDRVTDPASLLGEATERARAALVAGDDAAAAAALVDELERLARARNAPDDDRATFVEIVAQVDRARGLVSATDLARDNGATVSDLYRWSVRYLGTTPDAYLAAVRFTGFVREAVGPGPVRPADAVGALRWYAASGQAPREIERFTGLTPAELRRVEERLTTLLPT